MVTKKQAESSYKIKCRQVLPDLTIEAAQRRLLGHFKHPGHHPRVDRDLIEFERGDPGAIFGTHHFARNRDAGLADIVLQPGLTDFASAAIGSDNFTFEMAANIDKIIELIA